MRIYYTNAYLLYKYTTEKIGTLPRNKKTATSHVELRQEMVFSYMNYTQPTIH